MLWPKIMQKPVNNRESHSHSRSLSSSLESSRWCFLRPSLSFSLLFLEEPIWDKQIYNNSNNTITLNNTHHKFYLSIYLSTRVTVWPTGSCSHIPSPGCSWYSRRQLQPLNWCLALTCINTHPRGYITTTSSCRLVPILYEERVGTRLVHLRKVCNETPQINKLHP